MKSRKLLTVKLFSAEAKVKPDGRKSRKSPRETFIVAWLPLATSSTSFSFIHFTLCGWRNGVISIYWNACNIFHKQPFLGRKNDNLDAIHTLFTDFAAWSMVGRLGVKCLHMYEWIKTMFRSDSRAFIFIYCICLLGFFPRASQTRNDGNIPKYIYWWDLEKNLKSIFKSNGNAGDFLIWMRTWATGTNLDRCCDRWGIQMRASKFFDFAFSFDKKLFILKFSSADNGELEWRKVSWNYLSFM